MNPPSQGGGNMSAGDNAPAQQQASSSTSAQPPQQAASGGGATQGRKKQQPEPRRRIMSDAFMISRYKISMCKRTDPHNWRLCPYAHEGEAGRRRPPHMYQAVMCDFAKTKECPHGDGCPFARNPLEYWLHPDKYRTALCGQGEACTRNICFFAHNQQELRAPGSKPSGKSDKKQDAASEAATLLGQLSLGLGAGSSSTQLLQQAQLAAWQSGPSSADSSTLAGARANWMRRGSGDVLLQQQQQQLMLAQAQGLTSPDGTQGPMLAAAAVAAAAAAAAGAAGASVQPSTPRALPGSSADGLTYLDGAVAACPEAVAANVFHTALTTLQLQQQQQQHKVSGQASSARPLQVPPGLAAAQQMQQGLMAQGMAPAYAWQAAPAAGMMPGQQNPVCQPYTQPAWLPAVQGMYGAAQMPGGYVLAPAAYHSQAMTTAMMAQQQAQLMAPYLQVVQQQPGGYGVAAAAAVGAAAAVNQQAPGGGEGAQPSQLMGMMPYQLQPHPQG